MGKYLDIANRVAIRSADRPSQSETPATSRGAEPGTTYTTETTKGAARGVAQATTKTTETTYPSSWPKDRQPVDSFRNHVLGMTLDEFARSRFRAELRMPGCSQTLWWVPTSLDAAALMRQGITRGRIWTAEELQRIWDLDHLDQEHVQTLARSKMEMGCELTALDPDDGDAS